MEHVRNAGDGSLGATDVYHPSTQSQFGPLIFIVVLKCQSASAVNLKRRSNRWC